jgi:hypothetical protein
MPHRFRPPKKTDIKKWEVVKFLIEHGFKYQHIYKDVSLNNGIVDYSNYAVYPDNMKEAKEFAEKYSGQAIKK